MSERASWPICRPVSCHSVRLKDMPVVILPRGAVMAADEDAAEEDEEDEEEDEEEEEGGWGSKRAC